MGHEKLAQAQIRAMTAADLNRFLIQCSLMLYLYGPGYSPTETLSKDANLMRAVTRYKVDAAKITATVIAEVSAKRKDGKAQQHTRWTSASKAGSLPP